MASDLYRHLGWHDDQKPPSSAQADIDACVLVKDTVNTRGDFVLASFIALQLKRGKRVAFVSAASSYSHYSILVRKLGTNLSNYTKSGHFLHLDLSHRDFTPSFIKGTNLSLVFKRLREYNEAGDVSVVVDDVNLLCSTGSVPTAGSTVSTSAVVCDFLSYLQQMTGRNQKASSLVALCHRDIEEDIEVLDVLERRADLVIDVQDLLTGQSRDVHGQLRFWRPRTVSRTGKSLLHFKCTESVIQVFLRGTNTLS